MKTPRPEFDSRWHTLLRQARDDRPPPTDVTSLLRTLRTPAPAVRAGWAAEFLDVFGSGRVVPACLAGAAAVALVTSWQVWSWWQALPWAQLLAGSPGGVL